MSCAVVKGLTSIRVGEVVEVVVPAYDDRNPGTSGLRKRTEIFMQEGYLEGFVESVFSKWDGNLVGGTLMVGGDGRYYNKVAIGRIISLAFAHGVGRVWVGKDGLASTPASSYIIRCREEGVCMGGLVLTASHNPGGEKGDFGIKVNVSDGGPAQAEQTEKIFKYSKGATKVHMMRIPDVDYGVVGKTIVSSSDGSGDRIIEVIDSVSDWMGCMKSIFDFDLIRRLVREKPIDPETKKPWTFLFDGLNGVSGPYARKLFVDELGMLESCLENCDPMEDFGGKHPDPNLTYASELVEKMGLLPSGIPVESKACNAPSFGAACDGDADRQMILGSGFFANPSDCLAVVVKYANICIPYFRKHNIKGVARSMPTSGAVDAVCKDMKIGCYETPTGWKWFSNLLNADKISICGEESFGMGSNHVLEKDGLWAILAWMNIIAHFAIQEGIPTSPKTIISKMWDQHGKRYCKRYDYENVTAAQGDEVMQRLTKIVNNEIPLVTARKGLGLDSYRGEIKGAIFNYKDSVTGAIANNQGISFNAPDGSRAIFRLSGTGSVGATIRFYVEQIIHKYKMIDTQLASIPHKQIHTIDPCHPLFLLISGLADITNITNRKAPDVVT